MRKVTVGGVRAASHLTSVIVTTANKEMNDAKKLVREKVQIQSLGNCIGQASLKFGKNSKSFLEI